ncbi:exodeoxyribonuclease III [Tropheryma whipplei]|uniref:exodeoxyribonuclease III n=1 Tax=Tropheryma whipplei TaxID=2039 RepID=UPI0005A69F7E|nr:exodeoxyribonuclease III [Tropheryma whipplei]
MLEVASVNVNGIRAAHRKGMDLWLKERNPDILTIQEVRAQESDLRGILPDWNISFDPCSIPGRAGVAIASKFPPIAVRTKLRANKILNPETASEEPLNTSGRWIEADYDIAGKLVTVVSCYVYAGEARTIKQEEKMAFLQAVEKRMKSLVKEEFALVTGDFNVGHTTLDIKNWRGNLDKSGFLPEERAYLDALVGNESDKEYNAGAGQGWIDVVRKIKGGIDGPYTWWSMRGNAFDNDTGWRIDYQFATQRLKALWVAIDRQKSYAQRWTDHAPVVVKYDF